MRKFIAIIVLCTGYKAQAQFIIPTLKDGVSFKSADNTFEMNMGFRMQNLVEVDFAANGNPTTANAMVRRSRLKFDGFIYNPKFEYKFEMGLSNRDIGANDNFEANSGSSNLILDAVIKYHATDKLEFWFGQTKLPGNRERVISSQKLQFVDRSLVNSNFNIDRDMGVQVHYDAKIAKMPIKLAAAWSLGEGRNITNGNHGGCEQTARVEIYPLGAFTKGGDYVSSDLKREQKPKLAIGATLDKNNKTARTGGNLGGFSEDTSGNSFYSTLTTLFVDAIFKYRGFSFMTEYANRQGDIYAESRAVTGRNRFRTGSGFVAQAGYLFKNNIEFAGRYTTIKGGTNSRVRDADEYVLGFSKYFVGHTLKIQSDFGITTDPNNPSADPLPVFRFQMELGF